MTTFDTPIYSQGGRATGSLSGWDRNENINDLTLQEVNFSVDDLIKKLKSVQDQKEGDKLQRLITLLNKHLSDHENPHHDTLAMLDPDVVNGFIAPYLPGSVPSDSPIYSVSALSGLNLEVPSSVDTSQIVYDLKPFTPENTTNVLDNYVTFTSNNPKGGVTLKDLYTQAFPQKVSINRTPAFVTQNYTYKGSLLKVDNTMSAGSVWSVGPVNLNYTENDDGSLKITPLGSSGTSLFNLHITPPNNQTDPVSTFTIGTLRHLNLKDNFVYLIIETDSGSRLVMRYNPLSQGTTLSDLIYIKGNIAPLFDNDGVLFGIKYNNREVKTLDLVITTSNQDDWSNIQSISLPLDLGLYGQMAENIGSPCLKVFNNQFMDFLSPDGLTTQNSLIEKPDDTTLSAIDIKTHTNYLYYTLPALSMLEVSNEWSFDLSVIVPNFLENDTNSYPVFLSDGLTIYVRGQKNNTTGNYTQSLTWTVTAADTSNNKAVFNTTVNALANDLQTIAITYKNGALRARVSGNSEDTTISQTLFVIPLSNAVLPSVIPLGFNAFTLYDCSDNEDTLSFIIGNSLSLQTDSTGV